MTVEANTQEYNYVGDGVTVNFAFPSRFLAAGDIQVFLDGVRVLAGFNVVGAGNNTGGSVNFVAPPAIGVQVTLTRVPPSSQLVSFTNGQVVFERTVENALDKLTMVDQKLLRDNERSVRVGFGQSAPTLNPVGLDVGDVLTVVAPGVLGAGPNASDIASAQANAALATAAAASVKLKSAVNVAAALALSVATFDAVFVTAPSAERYYSWDGGNNAAKITAQDPRYFAPASDPTGASGTLIDVLGVPTGQFGAQLGARIIRLNDRVFVGGAAGFSGRTGSPANYAAGIDPLINKLHGWAFRDSTFLVDAADGSMALTGHSQTSKGINYWAQPAYPACFGGAFFTVSDRVGSFSPAWALYSDGTRLAGVPGIIFGHENTIGNYGSESTPSPFNVWTAGCAAGVNSWLISGGGQDINSFDYVTMRDTAAATVVLSSYRAGDLGGGKTAWEVGNAYVKGYVAADGYGGTNYVCRVANTPVSGTFAAYRAANPTHWALQQRVNYASGLTINAGDMVKDQTVGNWFYAQVDHVTSGVLFATYRTANPTHYRALPGTKSAFTIAANGVAENSQGTNLFYAMQMPQRHMLSWWRDAGVDELGAFIWSDVIPNGSATVGITFKQDLIDFSAANGLRADAIRLGGQTNFATASRGSLANDTLLIANPGTGTINFSVNGATRLIVSSAGLQLPSGHDLYISGLKVAGARDTGWTNAATGLVANKATALNVAAATVASAAYVQAEAQGNYTRIAFLEARVRAIEDAARAAGSIGV